MQKHMQNTCYMQCLAYPGSPLLPAHPWSHSSNTVRAYQFDDNNRKLETFDQVFIYLTDIYYLLPGIVV